MVLLSSNCPESALVIFSQTRAPRALLSHQDRLEGSISRTGAVGSSEHAPRQEEPYLADSEADLGRHRDKEAKLPIQSREPRLCPPEMCQDPFQLSATPLAEFWKHRLFCDAVLHPVSST